MPQHSFLPEESATQKWSVCLVQVLAYPLLFMVRLIVVRNKLFRDPVVRWPKKGVSFIIYGNHQSKLDPMLICACLPLGAIWRMLPFRVMVANEHLGGTLGKIFSALGGFPAFAKSDEPYGLDRARVLLASHQTLIMFPPGRRTRERMAHSGISVLAAEPNVSFVPVHLDWKGRYSCEVHIGKPFTVGEPLSPDHYMEKVYELAKD